MSPGPEQDGNANGQPAVGLDASSVLANLPRTRPQRSSARRVAARGTRAGAGAPPAIADREPSSPTREPTSQQARPEQEGKPRTGARATTRRTGKARPASAAARPRAKRPPRAREEVPRQGFECEGERASGPVQPPGGTELLASATELVGELAKAGVSTGERLLKDVLSLLGRS